MNKVMFLTLAALALFIGACSASGEEDDSTRDANGAIVEAGDVGVFVMEVGDCFKELPDGLVESMEAVPCAQDHRVEVFHKFDVSLPAFDDPAIDEQAGTGCFDAFEPYVGKSYDVSFYEFSALTPTADSWELDDREVVCLLYPYESAEGTTGTANGSGL